MPYNLTDFMKGKIVAFRESGLSYNEIGLQVGLSKSTVSSFLLRFEAADRRLLHERDNCGRHSMTPRDFDRELFQKSEAAPFNSARELRNTMVQTSARLNCPLPSIRRIRRRLLRHGLHARTPSSKPLLKETHEYARYLFAEEHVNWDHEWDNVIFMDESYFLGGKSRMQYVRRYKGQRYNKKCVRQYRNRSVATANVWAAISLHGISDLHFINGRLNGERYRDEILIDSLMPFIDNALPVRDNYMLLHDNCPIHKSRIVQQWLETKNNVQVIDWPAVSPDLNPIENIWGDMKRQIANVDVTNTDSLKREMQRIWLSYRGDRNFVVRNSINSMHSRCQTLIS